MVITPAAGQRLICYGHRRVGHPTILSDFDNNGSRKVFIVRHRIFSGALAVFVTLASGSLIAGFAQTRRATAKPAAAGLMAALPASDAIAIVKVRRVLEEAMPKLLAGNPAKLSESLAQLEDFKTRTGIDPRSFDEMAFGIRYTYPSEGVTKMRTVAIANGKFSAGALVAAGRIAANGKYQEQPYHGKTIYIFSLDQQVKILGVLNLSVGQLAVSPLDNNTLALGDLESVREAIDVKRGRSRVNAELIALASRDQNAVVGFGGNLTPELRQNLSSTNDAIMRDLTAVRQVYGSIGLTERDIEVSVAARTVDEPSARNLGNTVEALKQFGGLFINRLPAARAALAKSALNSLKITNQGAELQIKTAVSQADVAPIVGGQ